jgi:hypothetical protein
MPIHDPAHRDDAVHHLTVEKEPLMSASSHDTISAFRSYTTSFSKDKPLSVTRTRCTKVVCWGQ